MYLPSDCVYVILIYCDHTTIYRAACVSKLWQKSSTLVPHLDPHSYHSICRTVAIDWCFEWWSERRAARRRRVTKSHSWRRSPRRPDERILWGWF